MEAGSKEIKLGMRRKEEHRQQREKKWVDSENTGRIASV